MFFQDFSRTFQDSHNFPGFQGFSGRVGTLSSAPHNTYQCSLQVSGKESFVSLKPECQSGGRIRDLPTFQADRFITTASAPPPPPPKLLQLGVHQFQREISKNVCPKINENKITPYDSVLSNRTCAMLDFQIH